MSVRALVACITLASVACSPTYQPRAAGIHVATNGYSSRWFKDGQELRVGSALGGLEAAMADVPEAAAYARTAHLDMIVGNSFIWAAVGALASAFVVASTSSPHRDDITTGLIVGTLGLELIAISFLSAGRASASDATNIYNDVAIPRAYAPVVTDPMVPPSEDEVPGTLAPDTLEPL